MIKVVIVEDEINARNSLKKLLSLLNSDVDIVGETGYVSEALELLSTQEVDLVFLDVRLEDGTGLDILEQLEDISFKIIFTTAYDQYAINAFKYSATDYLLKPLDPLELDEAIKKAQSSIENEKQRQELLEVLKNNLAKREAQIVVKTTEQQYILKLQDIVRLEADAAYTVFITTESRIIASKNLRHYQEMLSEDFVRCHQSHLVNMKHVKSLYKGKFLKMTNDDLVAISTRKRADIISLLDRN
ncbi:LytTR family DNA-binding domain-containing protein [Fulvivirga maritima]|uniref:LytR/AlgR family response regulator transcription factor n=1 Tax=Fulvivirga maritima TaxID=2904247 RepID=UPI001F17B56C|nr:LytTR family DNA-binding domain-containing protein [Fulvivirga maritima]UII28784.1 LytTR family DNA-binding domain-containing protein [Fulvivirga maritima]